MYVDFSIICRKVIACWMRKENFSVTLTINIAVITMIADGHESHL